MPRQPGVRWEESTKSWRSDVGPIGPGGRRSPIRFRDLPASEKGKREAEKRLKDYLAQRHESEELRRGIAENPPVWSVVQEFLQYGEAKGWEPRTLESYSERLGVWQRYASGAVPLHGRIVDPRPARDLTDTDLRRVVRKLKGEGRSAWYIRGIVRSVKTCWKWAAAPDSDRVPVRLIPANPFADAQIDTPTISAGGADRYFPFSQAVPFLDWIDRWADSKPGITGEHQRLTALLFRAIYESGGRPSELCRATWSQLDWEQRRIVQYKHKTSKKTDKPRIIGLNPHCIERLRWAFDREGRHPEWIFTHRRGRGQGKDGTARAGIPWDVRALGYLFRKLRRQAAADGLDVSVRDALGHIPAENPEVQLYDFRRSFTTDGDLFDLDAKAVADTQGHSVRMAEAAYRQRQAKTATEIAHEMHKRRSTIEPTDPD